MDGGCAGQEHATARDTTSLASVSPNGFCEHHVQRISRGAVLYDASNVKDKIGHLFGVLISYLAEPEGLSTLRL